MTSVNYEHFASVNISSSTTVKFTIKYNSVNVIQVFSYWLLPFPSPWTEKNRLHISANLGQSLVSSVEDRHVRVSLLDWAPLSTTESPLWFSSSRIYLPRLYYGKFWNGKHNITWVFHIIRVMYYGYFGKVIVGLAPMVFWQKKPAYFIWGGGGFSPGEGVLRHDIAIKLPPRRETPTPTP